jgi:hypothetical protein
MSELHQALLRFQKFGVSLQKNAINPHFRNRYISLDSLMEQVLPQLNECGLVLLQIPTSEDGEPALTTTVIHAESGEWVSGTMRLILSKSDSQAVGSAITYARRYALMSMLGLVADDDDDGQKSSQESREKREARQQLEGVLNELKEVDQDPGHGGGHYFQVAQNAAVRDYGVKLDDLEPDKTRELAAKFGEHLAKLKNPDEPVPAAEPTAPEGEEAAVYEPALPVEETVSRSEGPEPLDRPSSWAEVESLLRSYGDATWDHFEVFAAQARSHLFPDLQRLSQDKKNLLLQKAATVVLNLREAHDPELIPPPSRVEFQAHWSKVLDGAVLPGPPVQMSPDDVVPTAAAEGNGEPPVKQQELDSEAAEAAAREG